RSHTVAARFPEVPVPPRICVVGSANIDLTFRTPRLPRQGETLAGAGFHSGCGGKGANQAVMAARPGARVAIVGRLRSDALGEQALANFRPHGIDTTHVRRDPQLPTGVAAILVDDQAHNAIVVVAGANMALAPGDIQAAAAVIADADALLCQLEVPIDAVLEAFRVARAAGARPLLNPAPAAALPDDLLRLADLCVPNEIEIEALTGQPAATLTQAETAARRLRDRGAGAVIVTLG